MGQDTTITTPGGYTYGHYSKTRDETLELMAKDAEYFEARARDNRQAILNEVRKEKEET